MSEEQKFYDMLHEYVREDSILQEHQEKMRQQKMVVVRSILAGVVFVVICWIGYLIYTIRVTEAAVRERDYELMEMKQDLQAALYEQYFYEEEAEKYKTLFIKKFPGQEINLNAQVEANLENMRKVTNGYHGKNIYRGNEKYPEIALTFDLASGEELENMNKYIEKYNIKITIFISNERPGEEGSLFNKTNIKYIRKMSKMENKVEFGNHTWSHYNHFRSLMETSFKKRKMLENVSDEILDIPTMENEISRVNDRFRSLTDKDLSKIYRLPYGSLNQLILNSYASFGYDKHIMWSHNSFGSLDLPDYIMKKYVYKKSENGEIKLVKNPFYKTREEVLEFLTNWETKDPHGMNGAILLMHLGSPRKHDKLIEILPEFIEKMQSKGYRFVTVSEVLDDKLSR